MTHLPRSDNSGKRSTIDMLQGTVDQKIKRTSIWFYVIAAFQLFAAYSLWNAANANPIIAQAAMLVAGVDVVIGLLFVVFGYYAARKQPWAFIAGIVLYALRAALMFFEFFSPIALIIRGFLLFRMFQGLQACLDAKQAEKLTRALSMPQRAQGPQAPSAPPAAAAWVPSRGAQAKQAEGQTQSF